MRLIFNVVLCIFLVSSVVLLNGCGGSDDSDAGSLNETINGSLTDTDLKLVSSSPYDFFQFTATKNGNITVTMSAPGVAAISYPYLYVLQGHLEGFNMDELIGTSDTRDEATNTAEFTFAATEGQEFTVLCNSDEGYTAYGDYILKVIEN